MSIEAMKQARSVIRSINAGKHYALAMNGETVFWQREEWVRWALDEVLPLIDQAIAEAEKHEVSQEPVGVVGMDVSRPHMRSLDGQYFGQKPDTKTVMLFKDLEVGTKLYTNPQPKREWVGLTHSDIDQGLLRSDYALKTAEAWRAGVVFAMTKLKEKNT